MKCSYHWPSLLVFSQKLCKKSFHKHSVCCVHLLICIHVDSNLEIIHMYTLGYHRSTVFMYMCTCCLLPIWAVFSAELSLLFFHHWIFTTERAPDTVQASSSLSYVHVWSQYIIHMYMYTQHWITLFIFMYMQGYKHPLTPTHTESQQTQKHCERKDYPPMQFLLEWDKIFHRKRRVTVYIEIHLIKLCVCVL